MKCLGRLLPQTSGEIEMETIRLFLMKNEIALETLIFFSLIMGAVFSYYLCKRIMLPVIQRAIAKTSIKWDDLLVEHGLFGRLILLVPAVVLYYGAFAVPLFAPVLSRAVNIYVCLVIVRVINAVVDVSVAIYYRHPATTHWPVKGWGQLLKIFVSIVGGIIMAALVLDKSPWGLISGIGAMTAVLLLIFKDTILSFVAGMQLASYDLIRVGDWIELPEFGADGDVLDISLHTVTVQNFDKTIVAIPTHRFLDNSFRNWRGMYEAGGRRIKRSVLIDQSSIRFLDSSMRQSLARASILTEYLMGKEAEITEYNKRQPGADQSPLNGRRLTNLGTFRAYILEYLKLHPHVRNDLTLIVR
ncbi:MAG: mechanosensitive ion channel, partial [Deltaproteobacteria bacterium]|nr:mechanosensitive ion channel [Deltaproteobacteria bacterium]